LHGIAESGDVGVWALLFDAFLDFGGGFVEFDAEGKAEVFEGFLCELFGGLCGG
jgi:hypothetical protein